MVENHHTFLPLEDACPKFTLEKRLEALEKVVLLEGYGRASFSGTRTNIGKAPSLSHHCN